MLHSQPDGFFALPPGGGGAGVLVLHAWWGLNDTMRGVCTRLAENGFVAFAPDLYHGKVADTIADAKSLTGGLDRDQAFADIADAVTFLSEQAAQTERKLAVIGFSLGANFALELSTTNPERIRSVVLFYGTGDGDFSRSEAEYLGHFAETDDYEPQSEVSALKEALQKAGCPTLFHHYKNAGHWFFEPDRVDAFNPAAASLAWERTLAFLKDAMPASG